MMRSIALALLVLAAPAALAAPPPEARAQKEQGDRLRKSGDPDGAVRAYQAALKLDGGYAEAHEGLGEVYFATKQTARAVESFGYAVEIEPAYALAWYNLAFAARRAGDHQKARSAYEKYVKLRPTDADGHYGLAETQRAIGNRDAAIAEYQLFIDLAKTTPAQAPWVEKARAAQAELRGSVAATPVTVVPPVRAAMPPPGPPVSAPVAAAAVTLAAVTPAPAAAVTPALAAGLTPAPPTQAPPTPATPSRALIEKLGAGDRAFLSGDFRPALFAYQDAVYLDPTSAVARVKLARAYAALGHKDQADRQLKQALELDPGDREARRLMDELARPAPAAPPPAPAVTTIVPAQGAAPTPPPAQRVYRLTDDAVGPAATAPAAPDQQETSRYYRNALTMIGARDFKGAIIELDRALDLNPRMGVAIAARASAFYGLGRYPEAARDYETALVLVPQLATPLYGLAETYRHLNDPRAGEYYARYARSEANDVRPELRETARQRAEQFGAQ